MTTTDASYHPYSDAARDRPPIPYHVYLKPDWDRAGAWWAASKHCAETFVSVEEALAEATSLSNNRYEIVPENDSTIPNYWDTDTPFPRVYRKDER